MSTTLPTWFYPGPPGGWTADMLDHLPPEAPRHIELIDGSLIVRSPQTSKRLQTNIGFDVDIDLTLKWPPA
ncbi:hypothetical protein [Nonomuraea polychroma]|uniref:hypothetical protein n=1 Tax=Nonomuraea polychroma TaxID=46176 RepID=UPI003BAA69DE